jgi:hypothetical protein
LEVFFSPESQHISAEPDVSKLRNEDSLETPPNSDEETEPFPSILKDTADMLPDLDAPRVHTGSTDIIATISDTDAPAESVFAGIEAQTTDIFDQFVSIRDSGMAAAGSQAGLIFDLDHTGHATPDDNTEVVILKQK